MAAVSPRLKRALAGIELADSIAADPHKWMYVPYEAGAVLLREKGRLASPAGGRSSPWAALPAPSCSTAAKYK
jgi:glutamate/tyrosine decarboxylase-like PLP-dependent enzyme